jgi:hypothetical protein
MLKERWQRIAAVAIPAYVIALWAYALAGFPTQGEICEVTARGKDCGSYNILFALVWNVVKAADHWSALITAIATGFIAYFTKTIWNINRTQLQHARQVERAYISGGGGYPIDTTSGLPVVDPTRFVLTVQNYGKTQGRVTAYAVFVVDRANLPLQPAYLAPGFMPTPFGGIYQLGGPTLPITQIPVAAGPNPIAYGRLWYTDIFGGQHYFSFALPIRTPDNHSILVGINPAYTEST